jgi:hypothetical protein
MHLFHLGGQFAQNRQPGGPAGPFDAGRAGQGNSWACGNDVAVCRAARLCNGEGLGPARLMPQATAIVPGGIP